MVLILSDGGAGVLRIAKQLEIRSVGYMVYFTSFLSAGRFGNGSVIVGDASAAALSDAIKRNRISVVIDALEEPRARLSQIAYSVCGDRVKYIKYVNIEENFGARKCLSYRYLFELIMRSKGAVMYASAVTVSGIVSEGGEKVAEKLYVPIVKTAEFDTESALEYSVPIRNIIECDLIDGKRAVKDMLERTGASMIVCDTSINVADKSVIGDLLNIPVFITHNMGMEYPEAAASARDAAMIAANYGKSR